MKIHLPIRGAAPLYMIFGKKKDIDFEFPGNSIKDLIVGLIAVYGEV